MADWAPATRDQVTHFLAEEAASLDVEDRAKLESLLVPPYQIPVADYPGEFVWVVGKYKGRVLYWSDVEEGWELDPVNEFGGIDSRGTSQFPLSYIIFYISSAFV